MKQLFLLTALPLVCYIILVDCFDNIEILSNEDDDILSEMIPLKHKRDDIDKQKESGGKRRENTPSFIDEVSTTSLQPAKGDQQKMKDATANILGDVNKYGLWEYTTDNTGMGNAMKTLMSSPTSDLNDDKTSHQLEKQAKKMNEQINSYVENNLDSPSPTIDPMETPEGYAPTQRALAFKGVDSKAVPEQVPNQDVVTLASSPMQIEDEHGNLLDTVKENSDPEHSSMPDAIKENVFSRSKPTIKPLLAVMEPTQPPIRKNNPTSKTLRQFHPTAPLTERLLNALKSSEIFRLNAQKLLATDTDTDEEVLQKQKKLSAYLSIYEQNQKAKATQLEDTISNSLAKLKNEHKDSKPQETFGKEELGVTTKGKEDVKLLAMIKHLMKDDSSINANQIQHLLSTLKKEDRDGKVESLNGKMKNLKLNKENNLNSKQPSKNNNKSERLGLTKQKKIEQQGPAEVITLNQDQSLVPKPHNKQAAIKSEKTSDTAVVNHQKGGVLSEYTTTTEDADHPLGVDGPESPLMGYLEQESTALSNIKVDNLSPDGEMDRLEHLVKNHDDQDNAKDQEKVVYAQLQKLLKSPHKENPFSPEKIKELGKIVNGITEQKKQPSVENKKAEEQEDSEKQNSQILKDISKAKNNASLLTNFRNFMKQYQSKGKAVEPDFKGHEEKTLEQAAMTNNPTVHEARNVEGTVNSIEDQLKEIELQKEMLKNREDRLKELSQQTKGFNMGKSIKTKEEAASVDHKLELAAPQRESSKSNTLESLPPVPESTSTIYPSQVPSELQQTVSNENGNIVVSSQLHDISVSPSIKPDVSFSSKVSADDTPSLVSGDVQFDDITTNIKAAVGNALKGQLVDEPLHKSKIVTAPPVASSNIVDQPTDIENKNTTENVSKSIESDRENSPPPLKIDSSIKEALNKAGISDSEINSRMSSAENNQDVTKMIKDIDKNDSLSDKEDLSVKPSDDSSNLETKAKEENETLKSEPTENDITSFNSIGNDNSTEDKTNDKNFTDSSKNLNSTKHKKLGDERPGLPINNPKPNADDGYTPHANFHTTFRSKLTPDLPHHSSKRKGNLLNPYSITPHYISQSMLRNQLRDSEQPTLHIKHFRHKHLSMINELPSVLPPAGMGRPKASVEHIEDSAEPIESSSSKINQREVMNSMQPFFESMPKSLNTFLKHKITPAIEDISITDDKNYLFPTENTMPTSEKSVARIIKPKSALNSKLIDVSASKKSFGKLPQKPKGYLLNEIKHKLRILTIKRHIEKQLKKYHHHKKHLKNLRNINNASLLNNKTNQVLNNVTEKLITQNSKILVPHSAASLLSYPDEDYSSTNVIVPDSKYKKIIQNFNDDSNVFDKNLLDNDVTRSILPKAGNNLTVYTNGKAESIEEVFNIIGSEDQINKRSIIQKTLRPIHP